MEKASSSSMRRLSKTASSRWRSVVRLVVSVMVDTNRKKDAVGEKMVSQRRKSPVGPAVLKPGNTPIPVFSTAGSTGDFVQQ